MAAHLLWSYRQLELAIWCHLSLGLEIPECFDGSVSLNVHAWLLCLNSIFSKFFIFGDNVNFLFHLLELIINDAGIDFHALQVVPCEHGLGAHLHFASCELAS